MFRWQGTSSQIWSWYPTCLRCYSFWCSLCMVVTLIWVMMFWTLMTLFMMFSGWLLWPDGLLHKVASRQYPGQGHWSWGVLQVWSRRAIQIQADPQNFRLHGHIADLVVPSKTKMEELLHMCSYPRRSLPPASLLGHRHCHLYIGVINIINLLMMMMMIMMIMLTTREEIPKTDYSRTWVKGVRS